MNEKLANCERSTLKIWHVVIFSTQSLKRCIFLNSKYDALYFLIRNLKRCIFLNSNYDASYFLILNQPRKENFNSKSCFLKKHEKAKICRFHGVKRTKTWFFLDANNFQNLTCRKNFNSKSNALYFFQSKIWRVVRTSNQNLTSCENFNSNLTSFKTFSPKSDFYLVFQVLIDWWYLLSTLLSIYFKQEN